MQLITGLRCDSSPANDLVWYDLFRSNKRSGHEGKLGRGSLGFVCVEGNRKSEIISFTKPKRLTGTGVWSQCMLFVFQASDWPLITWDAQAAKRIPEANLERAHSNNLVGPLKVREFEEKGVYLRGQSDL